MEVDASYACMFYRDCVNAGKPKCSICWNMVVNFGHYVYFKDKSYYMKTLPCASLRWLFEGGEKNATQEK